MSTSTGGRGTFRLSPDFPGFPYSAANQLPSSMVQYDAAGDVTTDYTTGNAYNYDAGGRVCAVKSEPVPGTWTITGYLYDADGNRIAKGTLNSCTSANFTNCPCDPAANGFQITQNYVLGAGGEELSQLDGNNVWQRTNIYAGGKLVGTYDTRTTTGRKIRGNVPSVPGF